LDLETELEAEKAKNSAKKQEKVSDTPVKANGNYEEDDLKENVPPQEILTPSEKPKKKKGIQNRGKFIVSYNTYLIL